MNDKIPSQTEGESVGFSPYGTSLNWINAGQNLKTALDNAVTGNVNAAELKKLQIWGDTQLPKQGPFP